jgi:preprotein translocase subunit SecG
MVILICLIVFICLLILILILNRPESYRKLQEIQDNEQGLFLALNRGSSNSLKYDEQGYKNKKRWKF